MRTIPDERMYDRSHGWIQMEDEFTGRCGISELHLARLGFIEFVQFPDVDSEVRRGEHVAMLESHTNYFKFMSPVSGRVIEINSNLEFHPDLINRDPYGEGWIYKIDVKEPRDFDELLDEDAYLSYIDGSGDI